MLLLSLDVSNLLFCEWRETSNWAAPSISQDRACHNRDTHSKTIWLNDSHSAVPSHHRRDTASRNNNITSRTHNNTDTNHKVARLGNDSTNKTMVATGDEVQRRPQQLVQFMAATDSNSNSNSNPHKPRRTAIGTKNGDTRLLNDSKAP